MITTASFKEKKNREKITMLTAYDYTIAKIIDESGIDAILVGDSLGMVMLGYDSTLPVSMEDMIHHASAVARGTKNALVVADMPFMSYQISVEKAVENAGRLIKETGVKAVKLEGGRKICPQIKSITSADIPVMGHLGLTPQSVNALGGYKMQAGGQKEAENLIEDALALQKAGVFALVLECIPATLASLVTDLLEIPTIGIGAGAGCDGQVLVYQDMLNMYGEIKPRFVKHFGDIGSAMRAAFGDYIKEVKSGHFPSEQHIYNADNGIIDALKAKYTGEEK